MLRFMANPNEQKTTAAPKAPAKMVIPVINNVEALQQIAIKPKAGMGTITPGQAVTLLPGLNFVDADLWAEAAENPQAKRLLDPEVTIPHSKAPQFNPECAGKPYLVVLAPLPKDNPLGALPIDQAIKLVEEIHNPKELARLEKMEPRDNVRSALRTRHAIITKPGKAA
jgi:hypothetical protein